MKFIFTQKFSHHFVRIDSSTIVCRLNDIALNSFRLSYLFTNTFFILNDQIYQNEQKNK